MCVYANSHISECNIVNIKYSNDIIKYICLRL